MAAFLHLLESPFISHKAKRIELPPQKPVFLLIYLAMKQNWVSRDELQDVFYPREETNRSLRVLINRAKTFSWSKNVEIEAQHMRWQIPTDVQLLREAVVKQDWPRVISLHRKPLLSTFPTVAAPGFEAWVELEREALSNSWRKAMLEQVTVFNQLAQHQEAEGLLRELMQQDWLAEDVLLLYMEQAYLSGQRNLALKAYEAFKHRLKTELKLEPLEKTQQLLQAIQRSEALNIRRDVVREKRIPMAVQHPPRLVARQQEYQEVQQSQWPFTVVSGEPGIGKTRLLKESLQGLWLHCLEGSNLPYHPLLAFLRSHLSSFSMLGAYREDLERLLPESKSQTQLFEPDIAKVRLLEALCLALESFEQPIILDDLQWIDTATLELLIFLVSRNKIRLYATCRKGEESPAVIAALSILQRQNALGRIDLRPFSLADIQILLADLMGSSESPRKFSQWLYMRSGGNVFFILEILKSLFENSTLQEGSRNWHSDLDQITQDYSELNLLPKISELITRRFERLSPETQRVLQAASVLQEKFSPKLLAQLVGLSEWAILDALEQAQSHELIESEKFTHDLFRQSIYASIPVDHKPQLHAQVASLLRNGDPVVIANHWMQAEKPAKALKYYLEAIEDYRKRGWLEEAKTLIEKIQPLVTDSQEQWTLEQYLTEIYVVLGQYEQVALRISNLLQTAPTAEQKTKLFGHQAVVLLHHGDLNAAAEIARMWEHLAKDNPDIDTFDLRYLQAEIAVYQEQFEVARQIMGSLLEKLRQKTPSLNLIRVLTGLGIILDQAGDSVQGMPLHQEAFEMAKTLGARHAQVDVALNMLWSAMALKQVNQVLPLAEETLVLGDYNVSNSLRNNLAAAYVSIGQNEVAQKHYQTITRFSSDPTLLCLAYARLSSLYDKAGQIQQGQEALTQALHYVFKTDFPVAHIRVGIATLLYGNDAQLDLVKPLLVAKGSSDPDLQSEFEKALQKRGLSYPLE